MKGWPRRTRRVLKFGVAIGNRFFKPGHGTDMAQMYVCGGDPRFCDLQTPKNNLDMKPLFRINSRPMKYPTLHKVMLTTVALVASLALSAQAGRPSLSTAAQNHKGGAKNPAMSARGASHFLPFAIYELDDGTMENSVGFGNGLQNFESLWFNQFDVIAGQTSISTVSVNWGTPLFPDPSQNGTPVTIAVWSDPNGDGSPTDAVLLGSVAGTVQNSSTDTFVDYTFSPAVDVSAFSSFFVGDMTPMNNGPELFFQGIDQTSNPQRRSWIAAMSSGGPVDLNNPGNNDFLGLIDDFGIPGNWGIRADTGDTTPTPTPTVTVTPTPTPGDALWYNGDFNDVDGLTNEQDTFAPGFSHIYDDFNVPDADGWDVTSVFSNDLVSTNIIGASWEIRQGITAGNGGTLIASGTTVAPVVTPTGRSGFGFIEFTVEVTGLNVHLAGAGANYHLNVTPIGNLDGLRAFDSTTSGANCIGTPCGDNDNAFLDSTLFGAVYEPVADFGSQFSDFSMGVKGTVSGGGGGDLELTANGRKVNGTNTVNLHWRGATSSDIDVFRSQKGNGGFKLIATTPNDGSYKDSTGTTGGASFKYKVCEAGTQNCSNKKAVLFKQ